MSICWWEGIEADSAWGYVVPPLCIAVPAFFLSVGIHKVPPDCEELFWYCSSQLLAVSLLSDRDGEDDLSTTCQMCCREGVSFRVVVLPLN